MRHRHFQCLSDVNKADGIPGNLAFLDTQRVEQPLQQGVEREGAILCAIGKRYFGDQGKKFLATELPIASDPTAYSVPHRQIHEPNNRQRQSKRWGAVQRHRENQQSVQSQKQNYTADMEQDAKRPFGKIEKPIARDTHGKACEDHEEEQKGMALGQDRRPTHQDRECHGQAESARPNQYGQPEPTKHRPRRRVFSVHEDLRQNHHQQDRHRQCNRRLPALQSGRPFEANGQNPTTEQRRNRALRPSRAQRAWIHEEQVDHPYPERHRACEVQAGQQNENIAWQGEFAGAVDGSRLGRQQKPGPGQEEILDCSVMSPQRQNPAGEDNAGQADPNLDPEDRR